MQLRQEQSEWTWVSPLIYPCPQSPYIKNEGVLGVQKR